MMTLHLLLEIVYLFDDRSSPLDSIAMLKSFPQFSPPPLPFLHALPDTIPLSPIAAALPPIFYYVALTLLPPIPSNPYTSLTSVARNALAASSLLLFLRLPLRYHVPFSVGLTYQLALVGLYGAARILDHFLISAYWLHHVPRRVYSPFSSRRASSQITL